MIGLVRDRASSAVAILKLTTRSNLVGCSTGHGRDLDVIHCNTKPATILAQAKVDRAYQSVGLESDAQSITGRHLRARNQMQQMRSLFRLLDAHLDRHAIHLDLELAQCILIEAMDNMNANRKFVIELDRQVQG